MHIPDGFISAPVAIAGISVAAGSVAYAVKATNKKIGEKQIPMMGVLAAFIFAAQMLNFPVAGGTSGHFVGAALAAIILGPWSAVLIMSSVLMVQCFVFQDGGLLALGANIVNMGLIAVFASYFTYKGIFRALMGSKVGRLVAAGVGGWISVVVSALACAAELAISGIVPWRLAIPAMGIVHMAIGVGEGLITVAVISLITATRPDLLELQQAA
ncbi:MAG TPA: energy-coupling factor ABC transporter permease [Dehalococcoidia bacterium]|jgi:cobalt/nickel transport system permease protein